MTRNRLVFSPSATPLRPRAPSGRLTDGLHIFTFLVSFPTAQGSRADELSRRADAGDPMAVRAFAMFVDAYGAEAGDVAIRTLARGGVYLAGGIAAKNVRWFTDGAFVDAFTRKGRFSGVMRTIPVDLILNEEVGLIGAVEYARRAALESPPPAHG